MAFVAAGTVTIVAMVLLFGGMVIDQFGDTEYFKPAVLTLYAVYLAVAYGGVL